MMRHLIAATFAFAATHAATAADSTLALDGQYDGRHGPPQFRLTSVSGLDLSVRDMVLAQSGEPAIINTVPMDQDAAVADAPPPDAPPPKKQSYLSRMTGVQWLGIALAAVAVGVIFAEGSGGGGDDPVVNQTGGN